DFYDGAVGSGIFLGSSTVSGNSAMLITTALPAGPSHTLNAAYSGTTHFLGTTGTLTPYSVNPASTSTSFVSSAPISGFNQAVTFSATVLAVSPSIVPVNGGTVVFYDGSVAPGNLLGTSRIVSGGTATFTTSTLSQATHSIIAVYGPTANFAASTSAAVTQKV